MAAPSAHLDSARRRADRLAAARGTNAALLLIDLQHDYCHPDGVFGRAGLKLDDLDGLVDAVNALSLAARAAGCPVIWAATVWNDEADVGLLARRSPFLAREGLRRGSRGADLLGRLERDATDHVVEKRRFSAFHETALATLLGDLSAKTLVVSGVRTDFCVESTVRDAFFRDLDVFVVADAVAGYVPALHEHSLTLMNTVFAQTVDLAEACQLLAATSGGAPPRP